jgi:hypothetical protein
MHNDAAHREASRVLIAPCGLRDQTAESDDAGTPIPQRASGGVGSALMFRARYAAAVIVGFAIGIAAGWLSGRMSEPPHRAATARVSTGPVRAAEPTPPPRSDKSPPREWKSPPPANSRPSMRELQELIARCLYDSSTWRQQDQCLRAVLRLEAPADLWFWGLSTAEQPLPIDESPGQG